MCILKKIKKRYLLESTPRCRRYIWETNRFTSASSVKTPPIYTRNPRPFQTTPTCLCFGQYGNGTAENGRFQFYSRCSSQTQLVLDVTDDVLVGGAALFECFQFVHVGHVGPQCRETCRQFEFTERFRTDTDVL